MMTATPPPHAEARLDETALGKLRELDPDGRIGVLAKVLRTYEQSLPKMISQFEQARRNHDEAGLMHVAHTLRSSSAAVGALDLAQACQAVERHLRDRHGGALEPKLDVMAAEFERAGAAVRAILSQS
jgi:hypothetical protein